MPGTFLPCVVAIAEHADVKVFTQRLRHVVWDGFLHITVAVELGPIIGGEGRYAGFGLVSPSNESRLPAEVFHLNVKDHMAGYFLKADRRRLPVG